MNNQDSYENSTLVLFPVTNETEGEEETHEDVSEEEEEEREVIPVPKKRTYTEILNDGIEPKFAPDYTFPLSPQYKNGCFAFAINHILIEKYGEGIDLYEAEKTIGKPRSDLWTLEYIGNFLSEYNITLNWSMDGEKFFEYLINGEPVMIQYKYYISDEKWIGHFVAVYSFDEEGVWVSESISNTRKQLLYSDVFSLDEKHLQFPFATVSRDE